MSDALLALLHDAGGHLEAAPGGGEVRFVFPSADLRGALLRNSVSLRLRALLRRSFDALLVALRLFFAVFLFVSLALVALAILALVLAGRRGGGGGGGGRIRSPGLPLFYRSGSGGGRAGGGGWGWWFWVRHGHAYGHGPTFPADVQTGSSRPAADLTLLEAIFSFVFGDGPPGPSPEERWDAVRSAIRAGNGVVCAETIRPLLDDAMRGGAASQSGDSGRPEGWMIGPVRTLHGQVHSTDDGLLLYKFPVPALSSPDSGRAGPSKGAWLQEREYVFSRASEGQQQAVAALGLANALGVWYLGTQLLRHPEEISERLAYMRGAAVVRLTWVVFPLLAAYAALFIVVPAVRIAWMRFFENPRRRARNARREGWARDATDSEIVARKLRACERLAGMV